MKLRILFVEQMSNEPERCLRCDMLNRETVINVGERFVAMLDDESQMDARPRVQLCSTCALFVRDAIDDED